MPLGLSLSPSPDDVAQGMRPSIAGPTGDRTRRIRAYGNAPIAAPAGNAR